MKEKRVDRYLLGFLDNPLDDIRKMLEERHPKYENFRFKIKMNLHAFEVDVYATKKNYE